MVGGALLLIYIEEHHLTSGQLPGLEEISS
jgi:hypothetical protein